VEWQCRHELLHQCGYTNIHKPRDGTKENLLQHVKALANDVDDDDLRVRGQHAALLKVLRNVDFSAMTGDMNCCTGVGTPASTHP
jgi:hypothetical protein